MVKAENPPNPSINSDTCANTGYAAQSTTTCSHCHSARRQDVREKAAGP